MKEYFTVGKIKYEGPKSTNPLAFKYYNKDEMILPCGPWESNLNLWTGSQCS